MAGEREKTLVKNTFILTIGRICTQGVSFLLLPLYTALLSTEEYGIVDLFNTYISILIPLVSWEYDMGAFRFLVNVREKINKQREIISTVVTMHVFQIIGYTFIYLILSNYIDSPYKIFLFLDVIANVFLNTFLQIARGINKNTVYSFAGFLSATFTVVLNVITIALLRYGAYGMFISSLFGKIITIIYLTIRLKLWNLYSYKCFSHDIFREVSKYSLPCIPAQLSWWVVNASDRTIVSYFLGVTVNGIYSVANKFSSLYVTFYNIFNLSWTETTALHIEDSDKNEFFSLMVNTIFSIFSALCLIIISVMPFVYRIMVNDSYWRGYYQVPILMIAVLCQVVCGLYSVIYLAVKETTESAKTAMFAAIINIVVDLVLIKFIGLFAASVSTLVAYLSMAIYRYFDSKKYVKMVLRFDLLCIVLISAAVDCAIVYCNNIYLWIINVLLVLTVSILLNRQLIISAFSVLMSKYRKNWRK